VKEIGKGIDAQYDATTRFERCVLVTFLVVLAVLTDQKMTDLVRVLAELETKQVDHHLDGPATKIAHSLVRVQDSMPKPARPPK